MSSSMCFNNICQWYIAVLFFSFYSEAYTNLMKLVSEIMCSSLVYLNYSKPLKDPYTSNLFFVLSFTLLMSLLLWKIYLSHNNLPVTCFYSVSQHSHQPSNMATEDSVLPTHTRTHTHLYKASFPFCNCSVLCTKILIYCLVFMVMCIVTYNGDIISSLLSSACIEKVFKNTSVDVSFYSFFG